jgi:hypothetical protein
VRARRLLVGGVAAVLVLGPSTAVLAQATGSGTLGGFTLDARAQAINVVHDSADSPAPTHPDFDGSVPAAQSTISTGPIGHGLASIFWPGPLGGNFGAALNQINQVCAPPVPGVPTLPPVCVPNPQQVKDNAKYFNDPLRAETFSPPQGPEDSTYPPTGQAFPGITMKSHAETNKVDSVGSVDGLAAPGVGGVGGLQAHTTSSLTSSTGTVEAFSQVSNVVLANGMVTIDKVTSTAKETTDGQQAKGEGRTVVSGLKLAGTAATVDQDGIHLAGSSNNPLPQVNQAVAQALDKSGLKIILVQPQSDSSGPTGSFTAGALVIKYKDDGDQVVPAQVGGLHNDFTVALGGASASVDSSEASNVDLGTDLGTPDTGTPQDATQVLAAGDTTPPAVGAEVATPPAGLAAPPGTALGAGLPIARLGGFAGLAWSLVLFAVLAALGIGFGLRRVTDEVLTDSSAGPNCPLEEEPK